jgi:hypothetical protein
VKALVRPDIDWTKIARATLRVAFPELTASRQATDQLTAELRAFNAETDRLLDELDEVRRTRRETVAFRNSALPRRHTIPTKSAQDREAAAVQTLADRG